VHPITTERLGKKYLIAHRERERYLTLRDTIAAGGRRLGRALLGRPAGERARSREEFWALRDLSVEIRQGERVGIIGRNGSGKTTLLKVLSRVTEPSAGRAVVRGRVASMLEVGTGFHPELTGRENIFLNGSILGMRREEIIRKFDDIVAFAEIGKFLDTPVKRFSSGMYVRLAFSILAHCELEILLLDEVLAVGDAMFQKRCVGKMEEVSRREGRTVLIVSHNMPVIMNLCERALLLDGGTLVQDGPSAAVVDYYLSTAPASAGERVWPDPATAPGTGIVRLIAVRILQEGSEAPLAEVDIAKEVRVELSYLNLVEGSRMYAAIHLQDHRGTIVFSTNNHRSVSLTRDRWQGVPHPPGVFRAVCTIPGTFLNEGDYSVTAIVGTNVQDTQVYEEHAVAFRVHDTGEMRKEYYGGWAGVVRPRLAWQTEYAGPGDAAARP
jgi:lipopolysaccharide transport system ATP-binding protein